MVRSTIVWAMSTLKAFIDMGRASESDLRASPTARAALSPWKRPSRAAGPESFGKCLRHRQHEKALRRVPVIFPALVDDPQIPMFGCLGIRYQRIELADFE